MNSFIAIDIGTSSARSLAFSTKGVLLHSESIAYAIQSPLAGWQEQDPELIFRGVLLTLHKIIKKTEGQIFGVCISAAMHSIMAVDESGKALTSCILWADTRAQSYAETLKGSPLGRAIYQHTGTPIHPMSPLCKIAWLRDYQPEVFKRAHRFVGIKEYILFQLFGHWPIDYSIASSTGMFDIKKLDWYAPALEFAGITQQQLPEPVPTNFVLQGLKREIAAHLGINPELPFVIGASDGCLANLGAVALKKGETVVTLGTSAAIRMSCREPVYDQQERIFNYFLSENLYIAGGASNNGGIVYQWFAEVFLEEGQSKKDALHAIRKIEAIPAGAEGLLFLPYLLGERAPVWDALASGAFLGVSKHHHKLHFQRAVLEGILLNVLQIAKILEATVGEIERIYANGGLSQIAVLMQIMADQFGKPIYVQRNEEASAFGAFLMGMQSLGLLAHFEAAHSFVQIDHIYKPHLTQHALYQKLFAIFEHLYPTLKDDFARLHTLK